MEITADILHKSYSEEGAEALYRQVRDAGELESFALRWMYDPDHKAARTALWAMTKATDEELSCMQPRLSQLIDHAMTTPNDSVRRLTLNLIERLPMQEDDLRTDFLDFCLEHMQRTDEPPGVQSLCTKMAYRMCRFYPELMDELRQRLTAMEPQYYTPGMNCVRSRILNAKYKDRFEHRRKKNVANLSED